MKALLQKIYRLRISRSDCLSLDCFTLFCFSQAKAKDALGKRNCFPNPNDGSFFYGSSSVKYNMSTLVARIKRTVSARKDCNEGVDVFLSYCVCDTGKHIDSRQ